MTGDSLAYMRMVANAHRIESEEAFADWCRNDLRAFIPFEILLCGAGRLLGSTIVVDELQGVDEPPGFIAQLSDRLALGDRWVIQRWLKTREPQLINQGDALHALSPLEYRELADFGLENIAAHGLIAPDGLQASYFGFSRIRGELNEDVATKLRMVVPHLHQVRTQIAWRHLHSTEGTHPSSRLTPRELEVLRWVLRGKTNGQIASLLGRSAQTVKHQVASVLTKLNVKNRTQAVSRALELGIVVMDVTERGVNA